MHKKSKTNLNNVISCIGKCILLRKSYTYLQDLFKLVVKNKFFQNLSSYILSTLCLVSPFFLFNY